MPIDGSNLLKQWQTQDGCLPSTHFLGDPGVSKRLDKVMGKYSDKLHFPFPRQGSSNTLVCAKIFVILIKTKTQRGGRIVATLILKNF